MRKKMYKKKRNGKCLKTLKEKTSSMCALAKLCLLSCLFSSFLDKEKKWRKKFKKFLANQSFHVAFLRILNQLWVGGKKWISQFFCWSTTNMLTNQRF
jgi:hypothetical protein